MQTFRELDKHLGLIPGPIVATLGAIDVGRGRQEVYRNQSPSTLQALREVARIQSAEASNAIENITAPRRRIEALLAEKATPENRPEQEIAGYRYVLDLIHSSASDIPLKVSVVEQFHKDLYRYTTVPAGRFKTADNTVTQTHPDGRVVVRFEPVSAGETPRAMEELHERLGGEWEGGRHHRLLLVAAYVFDFLMIHPFQDGNGRISRLLTLLLTYRAGYEVGRFISLEKLIDDSRETYYDSLQASTAGWHEGEHDIRPWLSYFLGIVTAAYRDFEERVGAVGGRGSKAELVKRFIRSSAAETFTLDEVRKAAPGVSDVYIKKLLRDLKQEGAVEPMGRGRGARWRRRRSDF